MSKLNEQIIQDLKAKNKELERQNTALVKILKTGNVELTSIDRNFKEDEMNEIMDQHPINRDELW